MANIAVKVMRTHRDAKVPKFAHIGEYGDLAADLYAVENDTIHIGHTKVIPIGIRMEFPAGYGAKIEGRSGLASRGVFPVGGVIDTGYRGEMGVILHNGGKTPFSVFTGDRIGQLRIVQRIEADFIEAAYVEDTPRGATGFGSTGR